MTWMTLAHPYARVEAATLATLTADLLVLRKLLVRNDGWLAGRAADQSLTEARHQSLTFRRAPSPSMRATVATPRPIAKLPAHNARPAPSPRRWLLPLPIRHDLQNAAQQFSSVENFPKRRQCSMKIATILVCEFTRKNQPLEAGKNKGHNATRRYQYLQKGAVRQTVAPDHFQDPKHER